MKMPKYFYNEKFKCWYKTIYDNGFTVHITNKLNILDKIKVFFKRKGE